MNDIFKVLEEQKEILHKTKLLTEQQDEKIKRKQQELKSLSFNSVVNRPAFVPSPQKKNFFDEDIDRKFMDVGPAMDYTAREALIFPDKSIEKNAKNGIKQLFHVFFSSNLYHDEHPNPSPTLLQFFFSIYF